jgi:peptidoglycan/xylan/chitin deacetylase (PgdA/CDA1 family)
LIAVRQFFSRGVLACGAGFLFSLLSLSAVAEQYHAIVLQYHNVADNTPAATSISVANLQRQMRYLAENRYAVLPLPELIQRLRAGQPLPDRAVAITFDDADRSVCTTAFPLLSKLKLPFTVFVNTEAIDQNYPANCSWEQLQQLGAAGVTLANHTVSHSHLIRRGENQPIETWRAQVLAEIKNAEQRILEQTGQSHRLLAWPYGETNDAVKQIALDAGYTTAFGQQSGPLGRNGEWLELPRFAMSGDAGLNVNFPAFIAKLQTLPLPIAAIHCPENPLPVAAGIPSLEIVLRPNEHGKRMQRSRLQCFSSDGKRIGSNWLSETRFRVKAYRPLPLGHSRYNCTLPVGNGRFYWYSKAWTTADADGHWPD